MTNKPFFIKKLANSAKENNVRLVWLHGWGQDHQALLPMAEFFADVAENYLLDLPGFGQSQLPDEAWDSADYASAIVNWLRSLEHKPTYIIGHSFGCRIGLQIAANYSHYVNGLILIAAPGLKRKRSAAFKTKVAGLKLIGKTLKRIDELFKTSLKERYSNRVGSRDYKKAQGILRTILIKAVNENLTEVAKNIHKPVLFIYGEQDNETPIELGKKYKELIPKAKLVLLPNQDHYTVLAAGRYQIQNLIEKFLEEIK